MTERREFTRRALSVILILAVLALLALGISQIGNLLVLLFSAWVIAVTLEIPVRWLQRFRLPRPVAVIISILILLLVAGLFIGLVVPPFVQQADALIRSLPGAILNVTENYEQFITRSELAARLLPHITRDMVDSVLQGDMTLVLPLFSNVQNVPIDLQSLAGSALPVLREIGSFIASALANVFLIALLVLLLLLEPTVYYQAIIALVPSRHEERALEILNIIRFKITRWLGAMFLSVGITTVIFYIVLGIIMRLPNALALSLLAGLATFVPLFGPTLALIPIAIIAAADGLTKLIITIVLYAAVGTVQDRIITPAIMKSEMDIPAAALVVFQLALAAVIGALGLLLAVPVLAILITLVRELYVFSVLGKKGAMPSLATERDGRLALLKPAPPPQEESDPA
jgi:predicted PurR-regulated permease PerM